MGNDSGVRQKSKQRTTIHKKHTVYPGMRLTNQVRVEAGSIKPINRPEYKIIKDTAKPIIKSDPSWQAYDRAAINLQKAINSSKAQNNRVEQEYALAYRRLAIEHKAPRLKRKYTSL